MNSIKLFIGIIATVIVGAIVIALLPWTTIQAGERGVVTEFGAFDGTVLEPGFHFLVPIRDSVHSISVQQKSYSMQSVAYTKDGQILDVQTTLMAHIDPSDVGVLFRDKGLDYENTIIRPIAEELIKNEFGKYTAIEIPQAREKIASAIEPVIRERLAASYIIVEDFVYNNEDFQDDYESAIKAKQIEEQNTLKAKNITAQAEESKKQAQLKADSDAYKTQKEVEALKIGGAEYVRKIEAEASKVIAEAQLEYAKHWTGNVPASVTIVNGNGESATMPFLPLNVK